MYRRGFTLIELLVVIAIISLLSSVVVSSINSAREKARDTRRMEDLAQIRTALELYYSANGQYPPSSCGYNCNGYSLSYADSWNDLAAQLAPYIPSLPRDPRSTGNCPPWGNPCYAYAYGNVSNTGATHQYDLAARFENPNHPQRCAVRNYPYHYLPDRYWCGTGGFSGAGPLYEASPN